jgi:cytochrome P450
MPLLHAAATEALRRYPVAPALQRTVAVPFEFGGYRLEAGEMVMIGNGVAHFDPQLYPEPGRFDLERCLEPRNEHRQPGAYAPFGLGAHTCAGAGLAEVQIAITAATLLHSVRLQLDPPGYELRTAYNPAPAPEPAFRVRVLEHRRI